MAANNQQIEVHWDQTEFEKLRASWSPERIAEDEKRLKAIFRLAADCPTFKEALDWANTHGIKFFVDLSVMESRGYYCTGTGVLGLNKEITADPEDALSTIVHEMRHAWQDYYGLNMNTTWDFSQSSIETALIEADANAFGYRAKEEYQEAQLKKGNQPIPAPLQSSLKIKEADLGEKFLDWFSSHRPKWYGVSHSELYGQSYGVYPAKPVLREGGAPPGRYELSPVNRHLPGMDITNIENILPLGRGFTGAKNYLAALPREILPKRILSPSLAYTFWGAANDDQKKLVTEIRKAYLKKKLAHRLQGAKA